MKKPKCKKSLTSTWLEIHHNFVQKRPFNLLSNPSRGHLVFESRLHRRNTWIEEFSKEIESKTYSILLESKNKEFYL